MCMLNDGTKPPQTVRIQLHERFSTNPIYSIGFWSARSPIYCPHSRRLGCGPRTFLARTSHVFPTIGTSLWISLLRMIRRFNVTCPQMINASHSDRRCANTSPLTITPSMLFLQTICSTMCLIFRKPLLWDPPCSTSWGKFYATTVVAAHLRKSKCLCNDQALVIAMAWWVWRWCV